ncbi:acetylglutamate semialdehyde dehydrogenase [Bacillus mycoides]|nr:acetylglutamate semialdehyde dehydrogenase [Bacillus mycoides]
MLQQYNEEEANYRIITSLSKEEKEEYSVLLGKLKRIHRKNSKSTTKEKGETLEKLVSFLIEKSTVFEIHQNIRTSSNEIDQLIAINAIGRKFKAKGYLDLKDDIILSECKNYHEKVGVTWVGKFASLMTYTESRLGLIFSYHGLAGKGWEDAIGLTKKLYLGRPKDEKLFILDFNKEDFERIEKGHNLLELIKAKTLALQTDTKFEHLITSHPAQ